jgi:glutamate-1-semialdehyde 2,1-aminomutase
MSISWDQARALMPGGVNSPIRSGYMIDVSPPLIAYGKGATIYDVTGRSYIDMCMSYGALLHGHAHDDIVQASHEALLRGTTFGATTKVEIDCAQAIQQALPSMERIRFVSSGTEATMSAVRLARAATGRDNVITCIGNYHGHADQFLVQAGSGFQKCTPLSSSSGIPEAFIRHTISVPYNNIEVLEMALRGASIAAVMLEPICANMGVVLPNEGYLQKVRSLCDQYGALLIFDEVVTGFRVDFHGAQGLYKVTPDLTCLGKIMGGGFPAAAFGGKKEIMNLLAPLGCVYQAGTLSGNPIAMTAGCAALRLAGRSGFYDELESRAQLLCSPIEQCIKRLGLRATLQKCGSMMTLFWGTQRGEEAAKEPTTSGEYRAFYLEMLRSGIYLPPAQNEAWFISSAHSARDMGKVSEAICQYCEKLK